MTAELENREERHNVGNGVFHILELFAPIIDA